MTTTNYEATRCDGLSSWGKDHPRDNVPSNRRAGTCTEQGLTTAVQNPVKTTSDWALGSHNYKLHRVTTVQTMWNSPTFPERFAALGTLSVTDIVPVLVLLSVVGVGMQQCMIQNHTLNT